MYINPYFLAIDFPKGDAILPWKTLSWESCLEGRCTQIWRLWFSKLSPIGYSRGRNWRYDKTSLSVGDAVSEIFVTLNPLLSWIHLAQDQEDLRLDRVVVLCFRKWDGETPVMLSLSTNSPYLLEVNSFFSSQFHPWRAGMWHMN